MHNDETIANHNQMKIEYLKPQLTFSKWNAASKRVHAKLSANVIEANANAFQPVWGAIRNSVLFDINISHQYLDYIIFIRTQNET
jgi:hypothetical protein